MKVVFHGANAACFLPGFADLLSAQCHVIALSETLAGPGEVEHYQTADVVIGIRLDASMPRPTQARLFHAPAAGTDGINTALLADATALCNCFGHEHAIAEYVLGALLTRHVPLAAADAELRQQRWQWFAGRPGATRTELGSQTIGLLGFGHIGKALAHRARAFGMRIHACNRSPVDSPLVDRFWALGALEPFMGSADVIVVSLPLVPATRGLIGARALATMRPDALLINIGRGPVIDEQALFDALSTRRIGGAVIDTWYRYPTEREPECRPATCDFESLDNVLMTPHMSGWTEGTVRRRQQTMADNIARLLARQPLQNVVRPAIA